MQRKLRVHPEKVLSQRAEEIKDITEDIKSLAKDMRDFVDQNSTTVAGLAAPQFGESVRLFVLNKEFLLEGHDGIFINPEIVDKQGEYRGIEGCLSLPTISNHVDRAAYVQLKYTDLEGKDHLVELGDPSEDADHRIQYAAAAVQHEVDHLNGKLFVDSLSSWNRKRLFKKSRKAHEKMKNQFLRNMVKNALAKRKNQQKEIDSEN